jgi:hypothetical protein
MKSFLHLLSLEKFKEIVKNVFSRFPLSILIIFLSIIFSFILVHSNVIKNIENLLIETIMSLIVGFFLSA